MFVKICGITNREDAFAAIDAGAQALGFVFYKPSPRGVTVEHVEPWIAELPGDIWKVGVFVNESPAVIEDAGGRLHLDVAQLHGSETPDLHPRGLRVWKAFRVNRHEITDPDYPAEAILLDGPGSGRSFDWSAPIAVNKPVIVAGGLTAENVVEAVEKINPWGVDTASGVERWPGQKDHARMRMFIKAALRK